jgi:uncharacterized protein (TIGR03435 family)
MSAVHAVTLSVLASVAAFAQDAPVRLEFEVASVRASPASRPEQVSIGLHMDGSQARIAFLDMRDYIAMAYRVRPSQVTGPDWIATERFDLTAKLPVGATTAQIPEMLQAFLVDRFHLKVRRDKKDVPVYALTVGKPPLRLKEIPPDATDSESKSTVNAGGTGSAAGISVNLGNGSYYTFANNKFEAAKISMDILVRMLTAYVDRPILNLTELKGNYDLTLNLTPEDYRAMLIQSAVNNGVVLPPEALRLLDGNSVGSLFAAVQELGLKLDARKAPLDVLVIDQILKTPTDN